MKNGFRVLILAIAVMGIPALMHAQQGCDDSPEDPTVALVVIASAGALISHARSRFIARRNSGQK